MTLRLQSLVTEAINAKSGIKPITARTFEQDAACILEALLARATESEVLTAMEFQCFTSEAYLSTIRTLMAIAKRRRTMRCNAFAAD
jgi:hypothetical protein